MKKLVGDKSFYRMVLALLLPIVVQNGITTVVSLLDNLMVGRVGTEQMSGVSISNQMVFIFNLCIFGGMAGAGIFAAQFFGAGNLRGVRQCYKLNVIIGVSVTVVCMVVFRVLRDDIIRLFLSDGTGAGDIEKTFEYGVKYFNIIIWSFIPFAASQAYSGLLRSCGKTILPMRASIVAVLVNAAFNYILIFGKLGFPALGVEGAAYATLLSRVVEAVIMIAAVHASPSQYPFMKGVFREKGIDAWLIKSVSSKGLPLLANELLWSVGMSLLTQTYSQRGLAVVAGLNISGTVTQLFNVVCMSMGNAVAIIVGQALGTGDMGVARDYARKLIAFNVFCGVIMGGVMFVFAPYVPSLYNTTEVVRSYASSFLRVTAACMPIFAFMHACYFTLRSGGKTFITFLFDSAFVWAVAVPVACLLVYATDLGIVAVYLICQLVDLVKCAIGYIMLKKGVWLQNIVTRDETKPEYAEV